MKIEISKEQFHTLLELVYLGNWLVNSYRDEEIRKYSDLETEIFLMAKQFGLGHFADEDGFPTRVFETKVINFIEEYDGETFWDELVRRMALRDLYRKHGKEKLMKMSTEERFGEMCELENRYGEIFHKEGLDALTLVGPLNLMK